MFSFYTPVCSHLFTLAHHPFLKLKMFRSMIQRPVLQSPNMGLHRHLAHRRTMTQASRQRTVYDLTSALTESGSIEYFIAKQHGVSSPMKINSKEILSVALPSHNTLKQWHQLELTEKVQREIAPEFGKSTDTFSFTPFSGSPTFVSVYSCSSVSVSHFVPHHISHRTRSDIGSDQTQCISPIR